MNSDPGDRGHKCQPVVIHGMVVSLAAYVYASVTTENHDFDGWFAFVLFLADASIAAAFVPESPLPVP